MTTTAQRMRFRILDAYAAPHGGMILKLRVGNGDAPSLRTIKGGTLTTTSPSGETFPLHFEGFAVFGGKPSDKRFARTGRVDVHVSLEEGVAPPRITPEWEFRVG